MRVQHNIMAMNSYRNYSNNVKSLSGNLEKLSSGYKINRAGDDAAGLAISEKMRAQITGLNAAQKNVKDGTSLVKTAEGAMQEIQDMLNRMDYLATQSANGTYQNEVDRENLQKEVTALKTEINRIADSANFNGIKLLDGSLDKGTSSTTVTGLTDIDVSGTKKDAVLAGPEAQAGKWSLDLSQLKFSSATSAETAVTLTIGGTTIGTFKVAGTTETNDKVTYSYSDLKDFDFTGATDIGGVSCNISFDEKTGKITIEQVKTPSTTAENASGVATIGTAKVTLKADENVSFNLDDPADVSNAADEKLQLTTIQASRGPGAQRQYGSANFTLTTADIKDGMTFKIGDETYTFAVGAGSKFKDAANVIDLTDVDKDKPTANDVKKAAQLLSQAAQNNKQFHVGVGAAAGQINLVEKEGSGLDYLGSPIVGAKSSDKDGVAVDDAKWKGIIQKGMGAITTGAGGGLTLQIGDTADAFNQMNVIVGDMHVKALGIDGVDISNQEGAAAAIAKIKDAINQVSSVRGDLGAIQNRLDHTANNLSVMAENIQDAESTIRDTDVAEEMMSYVKNNILVQSAQAMLAQANQVPQGVLQLLG